MKILFRRLIARRLEKEVKRLIAAKHPIVVAVTGSVGKTSTKLAISHVLSTKYKVQAHQGNYNSEVSLPLSMFEMDVPAQLTNPLEWQKIFKAIRQRTKTFDYGAVVLELGADRPGDIAKFMRYLTPDIGVVTAVEPVHIESFKTIEAIFHEKSQLALGSRKTVLNVDDPRLMQLKKELHVPVTTYGVGGEVHFTKAEITSSGIKGELFLGSESVTVQTQVIGQHSLRALEAAAAVGQEIGLTPAQIKNGIETFTPVKGRMNPLPGKNGSTIIDDSYNASPKAVVAALDTLIQAKGRKIAILGNMNELAEQAEDGHRQVGAAAAKVDLLITIGDLAEKYLADEAHKNGLRTDNIKSFNSPFEAGDFVAGLLKKGDTVLVKGSQNGVYSEEAVKLLLADKKDIRKLVRQTPEWLKKKQFTS